MCLVVLTGVCFAALAMTFGRAALAMTFAALEPKIGIAKTFSKLPSFCPSFQKNKLDPNDKLISK